MRIQDYGLIGDMQAAALVGRDGAVDWLCLPRFDSGSCFTALLGDERHGRWLVSPASPVTAVTSGVASRRWRSSRPEPRQRSGCRTARRGCGPVEGVDAGRAAHVGFRGYPVAAVGSRAREGLPFSVPDGARWRTRAPRRTEPYALVDELMAAYDHHP
jgi:Trehalase-like, N-terminal